MLPNDEVFRFINCHLRVFARIYYHLRVIFKIFALGLLNPDWTPLSSCNGSTPSPGLKAGKFPDFDTHVSTFVTLSFVTTLFAKFHFPVTAVNNELMFCSGVV